MFKMQEKDEKIFKGIATIGLCLLSAMLLLFVTNYTESIFSCEGIEYYYTGESFPADVRDIFQDMDKCYNTNEVGMRVYSPLDLYNCVPNGFDCEDTSKAIYCLANEYGIDCKLIFESRHLGISCYYDDKWRRLF